MGGHLCYRQVHVPIHLLTYLFEYSIISPVDGVSCYLWHELPHLYSAYRPVFFLFSYTLSHRYVDYHYFDISKNRPSIA